MFEVVDEAYAAKHEELERAKEEKLMQIKEAEANVKFVLEHVEPQYETAALLNMAKIWSLSSQLATNLVNTKREPKETKH